MEKRTQHRLSCGQRISLCRRGLTQSAVFVLQNQRAEMWHGLCLVELAASSPCRLALVGVARQFIASIFEDVVAMMD